jgi:hypothetical protein
MKLWEALEKSNLGKASNQNIPKVYVYDECYAHNDGYYYGYDTTTNKAVKIEAVPFIEANDDNWEPAMFKRTTFVYQFLLKNIETGIYCASSAFYTTAATAKEGVMDGYEVIRHLEYTRTEVEV